MCFMCGDDEEFEEPTNAYLKAVPLIKSAYDAGEGFGALHIILEDGNIETHHIASCIKDKDITPHGLDCAIALLALSEEQRMTAIMLANDRKITYAQ